MPLRLLLIEDSEDDALLLVRELRKGGFAPDFARVDTPQGLEAALAGKTWDAVIADYSMPAFTGLDALRIIQAKGLDLPFILVSGVIGEEKAVEAMKAGAHDYIMKGNFPRLAPALKRELRDAEVRQERRQAVEELHRAHGELEIRVRERTAELARANEVLRAEITERRRAEDALRESTELLRLFIEHAPAALAMFDTDMRYLSVSSRWLNDYHLSERDLIGKSHYDVFPEITKEWREAHRRGLAGEVLRAEGDRFERADGSVQWVRWEIRPWFDAAGKIGGIVIFAEDITDIKEANEILLRYQLLARHSRDIILLVRSDDWRILEANDAAVNTYGYDHEELLGLTISELRVPQTADLTAAQMVEADSHGILFETVHRRRDGSTFPVEVSSQGTTIGGTRALINVIRDITERKRAEETLRNSENKFSTLFNKASLPAVLSRFPDHAYVDVNEAWSQLFGYTKEEVIGKTSLELGINRDAERRTHTLDEIRRHKQLRNLEQTLFSKTGDTLTVLTNVNVIAIGGQYYALTSLQDITERKRAEEKIVAYQEQLRSMATEISLVEERERHKIATAIHDQIGQTLAMAAIKLGELRHTLGSGNMSGQVDGIREMITRAIHYSRTLTFELSPPILYELGLEAAVSSLAERFQKEHGIRIDCLDDRRPKPLSDEIRVLLFQAVRELLVNAIKHARPRRITISCRREGAEIRVMVEDDGFGFTTADGESVTEKNHGFGLFSMRERLKYLGGSIAIESAPGRGTQVTLTAPLLTEPDEKGEAA